MLHARLGFFLLASPSSTLFILFFSLANIAEAEPIQGNERTGQLRGNCFSHFIKEPQPPSSDCRLPLSRHRPPQRNSTCTCTCTCTSWHHLPPLPFPDLDTSPPTRTISLLSIFPNTTQHTQRRIYRRQDKSDSLHFDSKYLNPLDEWLNLFPELN